MIRDAIEADFEIILDMSEEFWQETQFSEPLERDHTLLMVKMALDHGLLAVLEVDGLVQGFCAGIKSFSIGTTSCLVGTELAWWINPEHRKGRKGLDLMFYMEQLAEDQGIKYWSMASMETSSPSTANKIYERFGYVKSETLYTKILGR